MLSFARTLSVLAMLVFPVGALAAGGFSVSSPDFSNGGAIPMAQVFNSFGCKGGDVSPALHWSGARRAPRVCDPPF